MKKTKSILALLLAIAILAGSMAGCASREEEASTSEGELSSQTEGTSGPEEAAGGTVATLLPDFADSIAEKKEQNEDTVGWLLVPGTGIEDVVLFNSEDNNYYLNRNFDRVEDKTGAFFADRRSTFGDFTAEGLGVNTCIYGHSLTDIAENEQYEVKFAHLHDFRDPELAKEMPYIFFSTEQESMAFEVFAVFVANTDNPGLPYNRNDVDPDEFRQMVKDEILPRSKYNYDVELQDDDKFLVLSTCIYTLDNGFYTNYPNTYMRFAVMGRLVDPSEPLKEEASFTINEDVIIDDDGAWTGNAA